MATRIIRISREGKVYNQDYRVKVNKNNGDNVLFIDVENGGPWTIDFSPKSSAPPSTYPVASGSPFSQPSFTVDNGASQSSGPVAATAQTQHTYRYNVKNAGGVITDDPDIDVE